MWPQLLSEDPAALMLEPKPLNNSRDADLPLPLLYTACNDTLIKRRGGC